jgi:hypothetical protein
MPLPDPDPPRNVVRRLVDWPDSLVLPHAPHHIVVSSFDMAADGLDTHRYRGADLSGSTRTGWRGGACASMVTTPPWLSEWGFREHVNPVDGRGNGSDDFSRTAAFADRPPAPDPP